MLWVPLNQDYTFDLDVDRVAISEYIRLSTGVSLPRDNQAYRFPVSVKGVVLHTGRVVLLKTSAKSGSYQAGSWSLEKALRVVLYEKFTRN